MIEVPMKTTPIDALEASRGFVSAYEKVFGEKPNRNRAKALLSLVWIETARGQSVQNANWGNISASPKYQGKVWRPPWFNPGPDANERTLHLHEEMKAKRAPEAFRAYDSHVEGALDFVKQLKHSFPEVLAASDGGDPDAFRVALSQKYSKDYSSPGSTVTFEKFFKLFEPLTENLPASSGSKAPVLLWTFAGLTLLGLGVAAWWALREPEKEEKKEIPSPTEEEDSDNDTRAA